MRILVTLEMLDAVEPVEGSDRHEIARIRGWRAAVRKGRFVAGDRVLYFRIGSALPAHDDRLTFLKSRNYVLMTRRKEVVDEFMAIDTTKIMGIVSQGLVMNPKNFCEVHGVGNRIECASRLGVRDYWKVTSRFTDCEESSPVDPGPPMPFMEELDVQELSEDELTAHADDRLEVTRLAPGVQVAFGRYEDDDAWDPFFLVQCYGVPTKSRCLKAVESMNLREAVLEYCSFQKSNVALYGTVTPDRRMVVHSAWDFDDERWLTRDELKNACDAIGVDLAPVVETLTLYDFDFDWEKILNYSSVVSPSGVRMATADGRFSFRAIHPRRLLK